MPSCLVVGAGPGIGAAVARRFAAEGHDVGLLARRPAPLDALRAEIAGLGVRATTVPADAARPDALKEALDQAVGELGRPSSIVYNAVSWPPGDLLDVDPAELHSSLAVNAVGPVVAGRAVAEHGAAGASLLITGGGIALDPSAAAGALSVGKSASRLVTRLLAESLGGRGIHVATVLVAGQVAPGTRFDPDAIAGELWRLHAQDATSWEHETIWR